MPPLPRAVASLARHRSKCVCARRKVCVEVCGRCAGAVVMAVGEKEAGGMRGVGGIVVAAAASAVFGKRAAQLTRRVPAPALGVKGTVAAAAVQIRSERPAAGFGCGES